MSGALALPVASLGQTLRGKVTDAQTKEPLVDAVVILKKNNFSANVAIGLDGSFAFKNLDEGAYTIAIQYVGYAPYAATVEIGKGKPAPLLNIEMSAAGTELSEVMVAAQRNRENDEFARKTEQKADNVLNIVSAKAIEISPDITVGNVLQRVSGVSTIRSSSGDGQYAIIRGMDKRYSYTLINSILIPSPDDKSRSVPMDLFPADMIERLEVDKGLTPDMEGNAIAGAMNLHMKNAPDHLTVTANLATGVSSVFFNRPFSGYDNSSIKFSAPNEVNGFNYVAKPSDFSVSQFNYHNVSLPLNTFAGLSVGNRFLNNKLGFLVAGTYQQQYRGGNTVFYHPFTQPNADPEPNTPIFDEVHNREYSYLQTRSGLHGKLDYFISKTDQLHFYSVFLQLNEDQHRHDLITALGGTGEIHFHDLSRIKRQNVFNNTLSGDHAITNAFKIDWSLAYSVATSKIPDWAEFDTYRVDTLASDGKIHSSPQYVSNIEHRWIHGKDEDKAGYLNGTYALFDNVEIKAGGMFRLKDKSNFYTSYVLSSVLPGANNNRQVFTSVDASIFNFFPSSNAVGSTTDANNYSANEKIYAGYVETKLTFEKLQVVGGVRFENTHQGWYSQLDSTLRGKTGTIDYLDVLPSAHVKYALTPTQNIRLSYFKGISRPSLFELIPSNLPGEFFDESGNYDLKHTQADNFDLRYEYFPSQVDHLFAGLFYKNITNPIEYGFVKNNGANNAVLYTPLNSDKAVNYGFELVFAKFFNRLGVSGNYSYTHSSVTTTKKVYGRDASGNLVNSLADQTRPLQGQSDHIANLSILYKDQKMGVDAQLSLVYTGKRINLISPYLDLDYWQRATTQLDFSAEKRFKGHFAVFTKITNLLNNPIIIDVLHKNNLYGLADQTDPNRILVQKDVFNQTYMLGLRYKL